MTLRRRLALLAAAAVAVAVVLTSAISYVAVRAELRDEVDRALLDQARLIDALPAPIRVRLQPGQIPALPQIEGPAAYTQIVAPDGRVDAVAAPGRLPVDAEVRAIAADAREGTLRDVEVDGRHLRMLVRHVPGVGAVQLARSLESADAVLRRLAVVLAVVCLLGVALAALLGRIVARRALAPIADLTDAAEHIELTGDLARRIDAPGSDEVGRLAARFNAMLDQLQASVVAQRRLVADASHELRTPITSLRTNIEVLLAADDLAPEERRALLRDVAEQSDELGLLVGDVIELARDERAAEAQESEEVRLDHVVEEALRRARRHHGPAVAFSATLEPTVVDGRPDRLGRAVNNLLDNAARHGGPGRVDVTLHAGALTVRDHGPGVPAADAPHVFDRFRRGTGAQHVAGSGLGLAIVRQVAEAHGGSVALEAPGEGGGAAFVLRLPAGKPASAANAPA